MMLLEGQLKSGQNFCTYKYDAVFKDIYLYQTNLLCRFFYKEREEENYVVYFPNFNLTVRDPGNYGELAMITLPLPVRAKFVILGIVSYNENPCLKFELMGCAVDPSEQVMKYF